MKKLYRGNELIDMYFPNHKYFDCDSLFYRYVNSVDRHLH